MFAETVTDYWLPSDRSRIPAKAEDYRVIVDDTLRAAHPLAVLDLIGSGGILTVTSELATTLGLTDDLLLGDQALRLRLEATGLTLNGADHLLYLPIEEDPVLRVGFPGTRTRQLTEADTVAFAEFSVEVPEDELDEAFVELDHRLVFGTFVGDQLVCAASMYPWRGSRLADLGVITLPSQRGRGFATATVRAISAHAIADGYQPQYRCQLDNAPSIALARAAGFAPFGTWDVLVLED